MGLCWDNTTRQVVLGIKGHCLAFHANLGRMHEEAEHSLKSLRVVCGPELAQDFLKHKYDYKY